MSIDARATISRLAPGARVFGKFRLRMMLGVGGMGVVWRAHDEELGFDLALKFISPDLLHDHGAVEDLKRETRRGMSMSHPGIVRVYGYHAADGLAAVSMECVEGNTLAQLRAQSGALFFEATELAAWLEEFFEAMHYAHHEAGLVHRDLKPSNVMVDARGRLKIGDFGIAGRLSSALTRSMTAKAGVGLGTAAYASPQQVLGQQACISHDIYGAGAMLYDLLTGKPPFFEGDIVSQVTQVVPPTVAARREVLWSRRGEPLPPGWEEAIAACLSKDAADRPASMRVLAERLGLQADRAAPRRGTVSELVRESDPENPSSADLPTVRALEVAAVRVPPVASRASSAAAGLPGGQVARAGGDVSAESASGAGVQVLATTRARTSRPRRIATAPWLWAGALAAVIAGGWLVWHLMVNKSEAVVSTVPPVLPVAASPVAAPLPAPSLSPGRLRFRAPTSARVSVDGLEPTGSFDEGVTVPWGRRRVRVEKNGYLPAEFEVDIPPGGVIDAGRILLEPCVSGLTAASEPAGMPVEIESESLVASDLEKVRRAGTTPAVWQRLPWGVYRVKIRDIDGTYQTVTTEIGAGAVARADVKLPRARLDVRGFPEGLRVWAGNRLVGRTPLQLSIPPGVLEVSVEEPGKTPQVRRLELAAGRTTVFGPD